jgi:hypothetical protein
LAAVEEAARLRGALRAFAAGDPADLAGRVAADQTRPDETAELAQETARLVRVSRAYAGSPVVAAAVAGREVLPTGRTEVAM